MPTSHAIITQRMRVTWQGQRNEHEAPRDLVGLVGCSCACLWNMRRWQGYCCIAAMVVERSTGQTLQANCGQRLHPCSLRVGRCCTAMYYTRWPTYQGGLCTRPVLSRRQMLVRLSDPGSRQLPEGLLTLTSVCETLQELLQLSVGPAGMLGSAGEMHAHICG